MKLLSSKNERDPKSSSPSGDSEWSCKRKGATTTDKSCHEQKRTRGVPTLPPTPPPPPINFGTHFTFLKQNRSFQPKQPPSSGQLDNQAALAHSRTCWFSPTTAKPTPSHIAQATWMQRNTPSQSKNPRNWGLHQSHGGWHCLWRGSGKGDLGACLGVPAWRVCHKVLFSSLNLEVPRQQVPSLQYSLFTHKAAHTHRLQPPPRLPEG